MDIPQPPADTELRNIIDKLAQFVARNGPEFEQMTKNKQKGNPKFQFLYGGEHFNYYQYKVTTEQVVLKQQGIWSNNVPVQQNVTQNQNSTSNIQSIINNNSNLSEIAPLKQQIENLQEQIKQSEQNLQAQHTVLMQQHQNQIDVLVSDNEIKYNKKEAQQHHINLTELGLLLIPIIDTCTKDSIQSGKSWILQNVSSKEQALCIAHYLLLKVVQGTPTFNHRLHVIYLVNDVLHHCARKNASDLKDALESVVVPMFCSASLSTTTDEQKTKLEKLLQLWESKANYLAPTTVEAMKTPQDSLQEFKNNQMNKYAAEINLIMQQMQASYEVYRTQHQAYVLHAGQQIQELEQRINNMEEQLRMEEQMRVEEQLRLEEQMRIQQQTAVAVTVQQDDNAVPQINPNMPPPVHFSQPPPGFFPTPGLFPDFSKPPPGFPPTPEPAPEDLLPSVPYYELPAGLMVPLIKLDETKFEPLDPNSIRLPPPAPPSERLLAAVEAFYALPSHERPRDSEGWEKLGLYEFYKTKNIAKKEKEDALEAGLCQPSRSPSPVIITPEKSPSPPRRRYQSRTPTPPPPSSYSLTRERDRDRDRERDRGDRISSGREHRSDRDRDRDRDRDKSPRSRSRSPPPRRRSGGDRRRARRRTRSRSPREIRSRSRTPPPSFVGGRALTPPMMNSLTQLEQLDSSNKGHQMLKKMGWAGIGGLGANEQGIDTPISGGDVRDRHDQFKGVGCNLNDPYENFRKNKGAAFITRMKARAEERAHEAGSRDRGDREPRESNRD